MITIKKLDDGINDFLVMDIFEGHICGDDNDIIQFDMNIAPDEYFHDKAGCIEILDGAICYMKNIKTFLKSLGRKVTVESDFYWSDGDLMIRIQIPRNHPLFKDL